MKKRLNVLMLAPAYFPSRGGVEKHLLMVGRELRKLGYRLSVAVRFSPRLPRHQRVQGIEVVRLPKNPSKLALALWQRRYGRILGKPDIIHSHDVYYESLRALFPETSWLHTFHGYEGYPLSPLAISGRRTVRAAVPFCFCVGSFIESWYGTPCDEVFYGAVEQPKHRPNQSPLVDAAFVGRLEEDTGFPTYLRGFKRIAKSHPAARLVVAGDGALRQWGEEFARKHRLPVAFKGSVSSSLPVLETARVAFVSGYLTILEAAMLKRPIISVYTTPIKRDYLTCHPMSRYFSIVRTPQEVANAFMQSSSEQSGRRVQKLYHFARSQTWRRIAERYAARYETMKAV